MRSLLFVPADGGNKLDKAMASGADAVIVDLEEFDHARAKNLCANSDVGIPQTGFGDKARPRLLVRINGLDTGMTDDDLAAIVPGRPDTIVFPKAEGGDKRHTPRCQAHHARSDRGLARGTNQDSGASGGNGCGPFQGGNFRAASERLIGMTWGPEDLSAELAATANRDAQGQLTEPYRLARSVCLYAAAAGESARRSKRYMSISAIQRRLAP